MKRLTANQKQWQNIVEDLRKRITKLNEQGVKKITTNDIPQAPNYISNKSLKGIQKLVSKVEHEENFVKKLTKEKMQDEIKIKNKELKDNLKKGGTPHRRHKKLQLDVTHRTQQAKRTQDKRTKDQRLQSEVDYLNATYYNATVEKYVLKFTDSANKTVSGKMFNELYNTVVKEFGEEVATQMVYDGVIEGRLTDEIIYDSDGEKALMFFYDLLDITRNSLYYSQEFDDYLTNFILKYDVDLDDSEFETF